MKVCSNCKEEKSLDSFCKRAASYDGLNASCRLCRASMRKNYQSEKDHWKKYYLLNKERIKKRKQIWNKKNTEKKKIYHKNYRNKHLEKVRYSERQKSLKRKLCIPTWLTEEQKLQIKYFYDLRDECKMLTGDNYHVDHIVPLRGKDVCGLHVPWNLQVLPADINQSKWIN